MPPVITEKLPAITSTAVAQTTTEELPVISTTKQAPIRTEKSPVSSTAKMTSENTEIASTMAPTTKPNTPESLTVTVLIGTASGLTFIVAIIIAVVFGIKRRQYNLKNRKDNNYDDLQMGPYVNQGRDIGEANAYMSICEQNKITRYRPFDLSDIYRIVMEMHERNDFKFAKEFQDLENLSSNDQCMSATLQQNRQKNRHKKSLPFDKNRVKLSKPKNNYINASHLKKIGNDSNHDFIVTQYPLNNTIEDFWTMIWEQNVLVIVMLTSEKDSRSVNYDRYFPSEIQSSKQSGSINVKLMTKCFIQKTELSNIRLKKGKKYRIIKHFQSLGWNDEYDHTMQTELAELIHAVKSNVSLLDTTGPIVVHCGLGTGRSGVFIALYQLMDCFDDKSVDIFNMVLKMRESRMHLIENMRQYIFIHDCFLHMISENSKKQNAYLEHFTGDSYDYIDVQ